MLSLLLRSILTKRSVLRESQDIRVQHHEQQPSCIGDFVHSTHTYPSFLYLPSLKYYGMNNALFMLLLILNSVGFSQNAFTTIIKESLTHDLIPGEVAKIKCKNNGSFAEIVGKVSITKIPKGKQTFVFSYIGYEKLEIELKFPLETDIPIIYLESANQEFAQIMVVG